MSGCGTKQLPRPAKHAPVTIKVTINRLGEPTPQFQDVELPLAEVTAIANKSRFFKLLRDHGVDIGPNVHLVLFTRRSKKYKEYVLLETTDDFRLMARSLRVKNHVKLMVEDLNPRVAEPDVLGTSQSSAAADEPVPPYLPPFPQFDPRNFSEFGDEIIERFKELLNEFPRHFFDALAPVDVPLGPLHLGVFCDGCDQQVRGVRYKCTQCHDYDLCSACETKGTHDRTHTMFKIAEPSAGCPAFNTTLAPAPAPAPAPATANPITTVHRRILCDRCTPTTSLPIVGARYKCLECDNFDLCEPCVLLNEDVGAHKLTHRMERFVEQAPYSPPPRPSVGAFHTLVSCDECLATPIVGIRYKCLECGDYDLCEKCVSENKSLGPHSSTHQMVRMVVPDHLRSAARASVDGTDAVYEFDLDDCPAEAQAQIDEMIRLGGMAGFVAGVTKFIKDLNRYGELLKQLGEDDPELGYAMLMLLVASHLDLASEPKREEQPDVVMKEEEEAEDDEEVKKEAATPEVDATCEVDALLIDDGDTFDVTSLGPDVVGHVVLRPRSFGLNAKAVLVMLVNMLAYEIKSGDLEFDFIHPETGKHHVVTVRKASAIKPEHARHYNLNLDDNATTFDGYNLVITASDYVMEGVYHASEESKLLVRSRESAMDVDDVPFERLGAMDEVVATVVPKSQWLVQVMLHNKSEKVIDSSRLVLSVVDNFHQFKSLATIKKTQGIKPGQLAKFNLPLKDLQAETAFKLVIETAGNKGVVAMDANCMSGVVNWNGSIPEVQSPVPAAEDEPKLTHLMVLPLLPKELPATLIIVPEPESATASEGETQEEDYDLVSDVDLDFEVLSPVMSNEHE